MPFGPSNPTLVVWFGPAPENMVGKKATKAVDPKTNRFSADNDAALSRKVLYIGCAQVKPVMGPNCVDDNFTRKTKPLQTEK